MPTETTEIDVNRLSLAALDEKGHPYDWSEGYGEAWEVIEPSPICPSCEVKLAPLGGEYVEVPASRIEHDGDSLIIKGTEVDVTCTADEDTAEYEADIPYGHCVNPDCDDFATEQECDRSDYGPIYNYYYPLPDTRRYDTEDADKLSEVSLCIVRFADDREALALTGCGMDMTWDIAEAYVALGFLPPVTYCELPTMSGYGTSERHKLIIAACKRSLSVQAEFCQRAIGRLNERYEG